MKNSMQRFIYSVSLCLLLAACMRAPFMFGGERHDALWDRIDYKECYEDNLANYSPGKPMPKELPPEKRFGACSEDGLANRSCK